MYVAPKLQWAPLLDSAVHALAGSSTPTFRAALHVLCKAIALRVELAILQPAQMCILNRSASLC